MNPLGVTPARWLKIACLLPFIWGGILLAETRELTVLFTNDMHDHIRADYDGNGGLAFVSGYIQSRRKEIGDVLVLDAGDVAEKGDLLAWKKASEITFKAFSQIHYDAWAPGNHDHDFGVEQLRAFADLSGSDLLCINLLNARGEPEFTPSKIYEKNGIRVGVIGMIVPRDKHCLNEAETAEAMAREAERLVRYSHQLVPMDHHTVAPDVEMLEWFRQQEVAFAPEANEIVGWVSRKIEYGEVGILAAEAIRQTTGADVAFNASGQVVRAKLPRGILDTNAVFRTGSERGNELIEVSLSGAEIESYVNGLERSDWYLNQWSGFEGRKDSNGWNTGLDPEAELRRLAEGTGQGILILPQRSSWSF